MRRAESIVLQLGEVINPYAVRKLIHASKRVYPTTYTFLAESQIIMDDKLNISSSYSLMNECIREYYLGAGLWRFKENTSFFAMPTKKLPSMPLYMLSRCNNILLRLSSIYDIESYFNISMESAMYVLNNHIITEYGVDEESISYYYNSDEYTINVNSEIVEWFVRLIEKKENDLLKLHTTKILNMILREQNSDGSWNYYSKVTMKKYGINPTVDCHHTASTLYNLIHAYNESKFFDERLRLELKRAIEQGMIFFVRNFFDLKGNGIVVLGRRRKASTMQYSEATIAIGEYLRVFNNDNPNGYISVLNKIIEKVVSLVNRDGSAPGDYKVKKINIDNINWGNGAALYSLCYYLRYFAKSLDA